MNVAALVRAMSDAGATPEAIAIAVEAVVARDDASESRRTAERERKRRYRTRRRGGEAGQLDLGYDDARPGDAAGMGQGRDGDGTGTGQGRDKDGTVPDAPPSPDKAPQTPKINPNPADTHTDAPACEAGSGDGEGLSEAEPVAPPAPPPPEPPAPPPPAPPPPPEPPRLWSCPPGVERDHWRDFLACRRRKRLVNTEAAYAHQLKLIAKFACAEWPPGRLVLASAERGWATIVDPLEHEDTGHGHAQRIPHRAARRARHQDRHAGREPDLGRTAAAAIAVFGAGTDGGG